VKSSVVKIKQHQGQATPWDHGVDEHGADGTVADGTGDGPLREG